MSINLIQKTCKDYTDLYQEKGLVPALAHAKNHALIGCVASTAFTAMGYYLTNVSVLGIPVGIVTGAPTVFLGAVGALATWNIYQLSVNANKYDTCSGPLAYQLLENTFGVEPLVKLLSLDEEEECFKNTASSQAENPTAHLLDTHVQNSTTPLTDTQVREARAKPLHKEVLKVQWVASLVGLVAAGLLISSFAVVRTGMIGAALGLTGSGVAVPVAALAFTVYQLANTSGFLVKINENLQVPKLPEGCSNSNRHEWLKIDRMQLTMAALPIVMEQGLQLFARVAEQFKKISGFVI